MANCEQAGDPRKEVVPDDGSSPAAPHPEEMKATIEFRAGKSISLTASSRATPAGLAMAALLVSAVLIPLVLITRQFRRREPPSDPSAGRSGKEGVK
jgi:hypothetical protein